jgi:hypothetical protein
MLTPKFVALDSATLGKVARDYWSRDDNARSKARAFIGELTDACVYITLTTTHVCELLGHDDAGVAKDRLAWLRALPLIAWVRPYRGNWFIGGLADIVLYELHAVVHDSQRGWTAIIESVQPKLLETGVGEDMFPDDTLWTLVRAHARKSSDNQKYIASIARIDLAGVESTKLHEYGPLPGLPYLDAEAEEREAKQFARNLERELVEHGDKRLSTDAAAIAFTRRVLTDLSQVKAVGGDPYKAILDVHGVPRELAKPDMTVGELGELAIFVAHLRQLGTTLRPPVQVSVLDVPPDSLPSFVLERAMRHEQYQAHRASGSDLGDTHIAVLGFYIDAVEVDKRTFNHIEAIRRKRRHLRQSLSCVFRSPDSYDRILDRLSEAKVI